jgi:predicted amidophosphoribosyltransferase
VLRAVASLVAPPLCGICEDPVAWGERICGRCHRDLEALGPERFDVGGVAVVSAARYEGVARRLVAKLKFSGRLSLAEIAAQAMVRAWCPGEAGVLVPVPGSPSRTRWRGFDTASLLTAAVARGTGLVSRSCLARANGPRQVGRPRRDRIADPPLVRVARGDQLGAQPVWLVDDVVTTGATLLACARVVRAAGVARVGAVTFARADSLGASARAA